MIISPQKSCYVPLSKGFDVVIVTTKTTQQEDYWQKRLRQHCGKICKQDTFVIAIPQPQGAFNDFLHLLAYRKAQEKAKFMYQIDLYELQKKGASIALYHDGEASKKLFPIGASELCDSFSLKLPGSVQGERLKLLEAVIAHTNSLGNQKGRFFVFRSDQILIPAKFLQPTAEHHIEIYGEPGIAENFGSFSLSSQMTFAILREFKVEFESIKNPFDSTVCFWLPHKKHAEHYERMRLFRLKFTRLHSENHFMNVNSIRSEFLWDYSSTKNYYQSILKMASSDVEGQAIRLYYKLNMDENPHGGNRLIKDAGSCLINCNIRSGKVINSVLIDVNATFLEVRDCVMVNSNFNHLKGTLSLFYNVEEKGSFKFPLGTIRTDVTLPKSNEKLTLYSHRGRNPQLDWNVKLPQNAFSFHEVWEKIHTEI